MNHQHETPISIAKQNNDIQILGMLLVVQSPSEKSSPSQSSNDYGHSTRHKHAHNGHFERTQIVQIQSSVAQRVKYQASSSMHRIEEDNDSKESAWSPFADPPLMHSPKLNVQPIISNQFAMIQFPPKLQAIDSHHGSNPQTKGPDPIDILRQSTNMQMRDVQKICESSNSNEKSKGGIIKALSPRSFKAPGFIKLNNLKSPKCISQTPTVSRRKKRLKNGRMLKMSLTPNIRSQNKEMAIPDLAGFIENKRHLSWRRIWVVVRGDMFSWKEKDIMRTPMMRRKEKETVPVKSLIVSRMQGIEPVMTGKSDRKFRFVAYEAKQGPMGREYVWKCATVEDRDRWVSTLRKVHLRNNCS